VDRRWYFEGESLTEDLGDLFAGEYGEWGTDEWFEALEGLATDARDLIEAYDRSSTRPDSYYVLAKVATTMAAQHRFHRSGAHDYRDCSVCSPHLLGLDPDVDFGSNAEPW